MKINKPLSFGFIIIAIILGVALYKQFDFANFRFEKPALSVVYFMAFAISILTLMRSSKKKQSEE